MLPFPTTILATTMEKMTVTVMMATLQRSVNQLMLDNNRQKMAKDLRDCAKPDFLLQETDEISS